MLESNVDENALAVDVRKIVETDRWNSFDKFLRTSATLTSEYERAGAASETYCIPTGGALGDGRWIIREANDIISATLDAPSPVNRRIVDYKLNPWQIAQWSLATPRHGLDCAITVIDEAGKLESIDLRLLRGRLVLTKLPPALLRGKLYAAGAAGVISDMPVSGLPDATAWLKFGWGGLQLHEAAAGMVGLVLSGNEGSRLRELVGRYPDMRYKLKVDVRRYNGFHDVVSGLVRGSQDPQDEVWALAHSAEPGARDNASGVAVCIGVARLLEHMFRIGALPRQRRTIRLLHGYECYGFFHYLEHSRRLQTPIAGVCIDHLGAKPDQCGGLLRWHSTAPGSADFVDQLGEIILRATLRRMHTGYKLQTRPFRSTDDTLMGDPKYGFPCPWITTQGGAGKRSLGYHSSADTPAVLHPAGLAAVTVAMAAYLYYLADAGSAQANEWSDRVARRAARRIKALSADRQAEGARITALHEVNQQRLKRLWWGGESSELAGCWQQRIEGIAHVSALKFLNWPASRSGVRHPAQSLVPVRTAPLCPDPENMSSGQAAVCRNAHAYQTVLFWADGRRVLSEIAELHNASASNPVAFEKIVEYYETLEQVGYVKMYPARLMYSRTRLSRDLRRLGVRKGMMLMVHSSLSSIGPVRGGADTVVEALLDAVGPGGTLLMPSFNHFQAHVYNPLVTPTTNGAIAEAFRRRPDAVRSLHPSHAVAAIGPHGRELCEQHLEHGIWSAESPIGRLVSGGGFVLCLGVDHRTTTVYHVAELAGNPPCIDPFGSGDRIVSADGSVRDVRGLAWRAGPCPLSPCFLNAALDEAGVQRRGGVGDATALLAPAQAIYELYRRRLAPLCPVCPVRPECRE